MSDAWAALSDGARRVQRAPAIVVGLACLTLAAAVQVALTRAVHVTGDWRMGFASLVLFSDGQIITAVAQPTDAFLAATKFHVGWTVATLLAQTGIGFVLWLFVTGGAIDRYARDHATRASGFFSASGVFFFRFLRLAAIQIVVYTLLLAAIPQAVVASAALGVASIVADYAKVRAVVEDRRSMVGAVAAAIGFIRRHIVDVAVLFALDFALFWAVTSALASVQWDTEWVRVIGGAIWIVASLWLKLLFWASETALFQMTLAHAGYVARPEPEWPESPAAEAI